MVFYKVGGVVRDRLLGKETKDIDWLVVGGTSKGMLEKGFRAVGSSFPVFLHPKTGDEYALARTEYKKGHGYGGFTFRTHPNISIEEDLIRRDLTINAMAEDNLGKIIDPYHGKKDLEKRLLRHVSPAFIEDPLRVLRVARFAARYAHMGFRVAKETLSLMSQISTSGELQHLSPERCWKEISRALVEESPHIFILTLKKCGALKALLPEIDSLFGSRTSETSLLEINKGASTLEMLRIASQKNQRLPIIWACLLFHVDIGMNLNSFHGVIKGSTKIDLCRKINKRLKIPNDCKELSILTNEYRMYIPHAFELEAVILEKMLHMFDVCRRPQRFYNFLLIYNIYLQSLQELESSHSPRQLNYLIDASNIICSISSKDFLEEGFYGKQLGERLYHERLRLLELHRKSTV